jgi:hypothetical protein
LRLRKELYWMFQKPSLNKILADTLYLLLSPFTRCWLITVVRYLK